MPGDTNAGPDVFVHDRQTGTTERVSVGTEGAEGNDYSFKPSISADGRFVAFYSVASTLVPGDVNTAADVFVRDRELKTTERVSLGNDVAEANSNSASPALSADGRAVAFYSEGSNLVPDDTNGNWDVFTRATARPIGVSDLSVVPSGNGLSVSGAATFSGALVASASDPAGDIDSGSMAAGADLTEAGLIYRPEEGDLLMALRLASLPGAALNECVRLPTFPPITVCVDPTTGAAVPIVLYGLGFEFNGVATRSGPCAWLLPPHLRRRRTLASTDATWFAQRWPG